MRLLKLAAVYNILWGAWVILFPLSFFEWFEMPIPVYPEIWQCVGMVVGVYGIGYWIAASDPLKHYPIVLVGFLGKVLGPLGFLQALVSGRFPPEFGVIIVFNDLIWLPGFFQILRKKFERDKTFIS